MTRRLFATYVFPYVLFGCMGCPSVPEEDAGEPQADAGDETDAGNLFDAGPQPEPDAGSDAGAPPDAGPPEPCMEESTTWSHPFWNGVPKCTTDTALVTLLHNRLSNAHQRISYDNLPNAFLSTDDPDDACSGITDVYSGLCWQVNDSCGNYSQEGDCYSREHTWPQSWWGGGGSTDAYSDLFQVMPADGYVNGIRGNWPFGEVQNENYVSNNGSKRGDCVGRPGTCFEPTDSIKGDLARGYFYFAVRYEGEFSCCDEEAVNNANIDAWQEALLRNWHEADPVDDTERARNEAVFAIQKNRNPFIDEPGWVDRISDF